MTVGVLDRPVAGGSLTSLAFKAGVSESAKRPSGFEETGIWGASRSSLRKMSNLEVLNESGEEPLLGTAAGLIAVGGAQAADLPVKAKAVEYVKICSLYGAGFYYIPGSDTCIKLGGYLRAEVALNAGGNYSAQYNGVVRGQQPPDQLLLDARS